jgi:hypothetical protein
LFEILILYRVFKIKICFYGAIGATMAA